MIKKTTKATAMNAAAIVATKSSFRQLDAARQSEAADYCKDFSLQMDTAKKLYLAYREEHEDASARTEEQAAHYEALRNASDEADAAYKVFFIETCDRLLAEQEAEQYMKIYLEQNKLRKEAFDAANQADSQEGTPLETVASLQEAFTRAEINYGLIISPLYEQLSPSAKLLVKG